MYLYRRICAYIHIHAYMNIYICIYIYIHTYVYIYIYVCIHIFSHIYIYMYSYMLWRTSPNAVPPGRSEIDWETEKSLSRLEKWC